MTRRPPPPPTFFGLPWPEVGEQGPRTQVPAHQQAQATKTQSVLPPAIAKHQRPSTMSKAGTFLRHLCTLYVALIMGYLTTANGIVDAGSKKYLHVGATSLVVFFALLICFETMRTFKFLDTDKFGAWPERLVKVTAFVTAIGFLAFTAALVSVFFQAQDVQQFESEAAKARKKAEELDRSARAVAECEAQKAKDVETLTKRRNSAMADHKKCVADWVKPSIFSSDTAEQSCSPKLEVSRKSAYILAERRSKQCPP
jgi:hypothetical protein